MRDTWQIREDVDGQWHVALVAGGNHEVLQWGEAHPRLDGAKRALRTAKLAALFASMRPVKIVPRLP